MTDTKTTIIHGLDPAGLTLVASAETAWTAKDVTLYPGDTLELTDKLRELNTDRNGRCLFDLDATAQASRWGRQRFGFGPVPDHVLAARDERRHAEIAAELDVLRRSNPHLARQTAASLRARELEAEAAALRLKASGE